MARRGKNAGDRALRIDAKSLKERQIVHDRRRFEQIRENFAKLVKTETNVHEPSQNRLLSMRFARVFA